MRIPSVSADPDATRHVWASAGEVATLLREAGLPDVRIVRAGGQPGGRDRSRPGPPGAPTVLLYAHHDVQPVGEAAGWRQRAVRGVPSATAGSTAGAPPTTRPASWRTSPRCGRFGDELPGGVVVFVEGEEESAPTRWRSAGRASGRAAADVIVIADSGNWEWGRPALTTSLRGGV